MKLVKRGYFGWGPSGAGYANPQEGVCIHYDGPGQSLTQKKHAQCVKYWKGVRTYHMKGHGWADIGYSFGVCPHSYVFEGRGAKRVQAAQPGGNDTYYSITTMLGDGEDPTKGQVEAVKELNLYLHNKYDNATVVKCHKDFISTSCPGVILTGMVRKGVFNVSVSPLLKLGSTGSQVKKVQKRLNDLHYSPKLTEDGYFGPKTEKAVKWFQKKEGLEVDGVVGPITWGKLFP